MRAAGWPEADFDTIAAVSGASALFGFKPDDWKPKCAQLHVGPDQPIADATGFGYEWVDFDGPEGAWDLLVQSIDGDRTVIGHDWESMPFAGYEIAARPDDRNVYGVADGPDTYSRWLSWSEFADWAARVETWGRPRLGRHTDRVTTLPAREVAARVMQHLVAWSTLPPQVVLAEYPDATFGLAGSEAFAHYLQTMGPDDDWVACHPINPQWTIRNSTNVYLARILEDAVFPDEVSEHLCGAATQYRVAYDCWQAAYAIFGHGTTEEARRVPVRRAALVALVHAWLAHEAAGLDNVRRALEASRKLCLQSEEPDTDACPRAPTYA